MRKSLFGFYFYIGLIIGGALYFALNSAHAKNLEFTLKDSFVALHSQATHEGMVYGSGVLIRDSHSERLLVLTVDHVCDSAKFKIPNQTGDFIVINLYFNSKEITGKIIKEDSKRELCLIEPSEPLATYKEGVAMSHKLLPFEKITQIGFIPVGTRNIFLSSGFALQHSRLFLPLPKEEFCIKILRSFLPYLSLSSLAERCGAFKFVAYTTAEMHGGMSGGPVLNEQNELVGLNEAVLTGTDITNGIIIPIESISAFLKHVK
jgi:S1-C subfamily serine protease